jgi:hypothetical protein
MHQSSERIGAIAAALAKTQAEPTNPEKALTASSARPFRASTSNGRDRDLRPTLCHVLRW